MTHTASLDGRAWTVAVAVLLTLTACNIASTPTPTGTPSAEPSTLAFTASPSPTASATPGVAGAWERAPDQPSLRAVQLQQVAWTGSRFIATGSGGQFLDSPDGLTWNVQGGSWPEGAVSGMASSERGIVAVGRFDDHAASWYSSDGLTWTLSPDDASLHGAPDTQMSMRDVTETNEGWLAVGAENQPCQLDCPTGSRAVIWSSADGMHWTQEPASPSLANAAMAGVTRGGPGYVAVGQPVSLLPSFGIVWTSADGRSWSRVADAPMFHAPPGTDQTFGAFMFAVTTGRDGMLVAVGTVGTQAEIGSALAWWSTDGQTWTAGIGDRFLYGQLFNVAATPTGFLATGPSGTPSCGIWSSIDGRSWSCVAEDPAFYDFAAYAAAGSSDVEVVVGFGPPFSLQGGAPAASVWVRSVR